MDAKIRNMFSPLIDLEEEDEDNHENCSDLSEEDNVPKLWRQMKHEIHSIAANIKVEQVIRKSWITNETMELITKRAEARQKVNKAKRPSKSARKHLKNLRRLIRKAACKDKM